MDGSELPGDESPKPKWYTTPRFLYLLVVAFLVLALGGLAWFRDRPPAATGGADGIPTAGAPPATAAPTPALPTPDVAVPADDPPGDGFGIVAGLATPWAVPGGPGEPTPTVEPTPIPAIAIELLGPPPGSAFRREDTVTFYWTSPQAAVADLRFVLYLQSSDGRVALGTVRHENLGAAYQLPVELEAGMEGASDYSWVVVLEDEASGAIIGTSELRPISILAGN